MRNLALLLMLLVPSFAQAGGVVSRYMTLYSGTVTADVTATTGICFPEDAEDILFTLDATYNSGSSTLDVKMQDSDVSTAASTHWKDIGGASPISFTQVTTASAYYTLTPECGATLRRCVRPYVDVGASGSPNYTIVVRAYYRTRK